MWTRRYLSISTEEMDNEDEFNFYGDAGGGATAAAAVMPGGGRTGPSGLAMNSSEGGGSHLRSGSHRKPKPVSWYSSRLSEVEAANSRFSEFFHGRSAPGEDDGREDDDGVETGKRGGGKAGREGGSNSNGSGGQRGSGRRNFSLRMRGFSMGGGAAAATAAESFELSPTSHHNTQKKKDNQRHDSKEQPQRITPRKVCALPPPDIFMATTAAAAKAKSKKQQLLKNNGNASISLGATNGNEGCGGGTSLQDSNEGNQRQQRRTTTFLASLFMGRKRATETSLDLPSNSVMATKEAAAASDNNGASGSGSGGGGGEDGGVNDVCDGEKDSSRSSSSSHVYSGGTMTAIGELCGSPVNVGNSSDITAGMGVSSGSSGGGGGVFAGLLTASHSFLDAHKSLSEEESLAGAPSSSSGGGGGRQQQQQQQQHTPSNLTSSFALEPASPSAMGGGSGGSGCGSGGSGYGSGGGDGTVVTVESSTTVVATAKTPLSLRTYLSVEESLVVPECHVAVVQGYVTNCVLPRAERAFLEHSARTKALLHASEPPNYFKLQKQQQQQQQQQQQRQRQHQRTKSKKSSSEPGMAAATANANLTRLQDRQQKQQQQQQQQGDRGYRGAGNGYGDHDDGDVSGSPPLPSSGPAVDMFGGLEKIRQYEDLKRRIDEVTHEFSEWLWCMRALAAALPVIAPTAAAAATNASPNTTMRMTTEMKIAAEHVLLSGESYAAPSSPSVDLSNSYSSSGMRRQGASSNGNSSSNSSSDNSEVVTSGAGNGSGGEGEGSVNAPAMRLFKPSRMKKSVVLSVVPTNLFLHTTVLSQKSTTATADDPTTNDDGDEANDDDNDVNSHANATATRSGSRSGSPSSSSSSPSHTQQKKKLLAKKLDLEKGLGLGLDLGLELSSVTFGAPAAHALGFKNGGLREVEEKLRRLEMTFVPGSASATSREGGGGGGYRPRGRSSSSPANGSTPPSSSPPTPLSSQGSSCGGGAAAGDSYNSASSYNGSFLVDSSSGTSCAGSCGSSAGGSSYGQTFGLGKPCVGGFFGFGQSSKVDKDLLEESFHNKVPVAALKAERARKRATEQALRNPEAGVKWVALDFEVRVREFIVVGQALGAAVAASLNVLERLVCQGVLEQRSGDGDNGISRRWRRRNAQRQQQQQQQLLQKSTAKKNEDGKEGGRGGDTQAGGDCVATGEPSPPPPPSPLLPSGWRRHIDPQSGEPFYANASTGETSWTAPPPPATLGTATGGVATTAGGSGGGSGHGYGDDGGSEPKETAESRPPPSGWNGYRGRAAVRQIARCGLLLQSASLLSTAGHEAAMIDDFAAAYDRLDLTLRFVPARSETDHHHRQETEVDVEEDTPIRNRIRFQVVSVSPVGVASSTETSTSSSTMHPGSGGGGRLSHASSSSPPPRSAAARGGGGGGEEGGGGGADGLGVGSVVVELSVGPPEALDWLLKHLCGKADRNSAHASAEDLSGGGTEDTMPTAVPEIHIVPVLFNLGVNEMQSVANATGSHHIRMQTKINQQGVRLLRSYYLSAKQQDDTDAKARRQQRTTALHRRAANAVDNHAAVGGKTVIDDVDDEGEREEADLYSLSPKLPSLLDSLDDLVELEAHNPGKHVELLLTACEVCRLLHGARTTSCKSAKDRTSQYHTLEVTRAALQVTTATNDNDNHGGANGGGILLHRCREQNVLDELRGPKGLRLRNAEQNIGKLKYAFNKLQLQALPAELRPPAATAASAKS